MSIGSPTSASTAVPGVSASKTVPGGFGVVGYQFPNPFFVEAKYRITGSVNGVDAKGGSIGSAGATVVNGMLYVTSGYIGFQGGQPGNLLLAFGPPSD